MPEVKVRRRGISAEAAATVIRGALGDGVEVSYPAERQLEVRRGAVARAKLRMTEEPGGTRFTVRGAGLPTPLLLFVFRAINDRGIARQVADAIAEHPGFRDGQG